MSELTEVAIGGSIQVLWLLETELTDYNIVRIIDQESHKTPTNDTRPQVPVVFDDLDELFIALLASLIGIDVDREGLGDTNCIRELNKAATSKLSSNQGFCWN
jgi:hypothetical protein